MLILFAILIDIFFSYKIKLTYKTQKNEYHPFELYNDFSSLKDIDINYYNFIIKSFSNIKEILKKILIVKNKYKISINLKDSSMCGKKIDNKDIFIGIDADFILFLLFNNEIKDIFQSNICAREINSNRPIIGIFSINLKFLKQNIKMEDFELMILHELFQIIGFLKEIKILKNYESLIVGVDIKLSNVKTLIVQNKYLKEPIPEGNILFEKNSVNWDGKYLKLLNDIMINIPKRRKIISELSLQFLEESGWFKKNLDYCEFENELESFYSEFPFEIYIKNENPYCYINNIKIKKCISPTIFKKFKVNKFDKKINTDVNLNYLYKKEIPNFVSVKNYKFQNLTLLTNLNPKFKVICNHKYLYFNYENGKEEREEIKNYKKENISISNKNYFVIKSINNVLDEIFAVRVVLKENNIIRDNSLYQPNIKYKLFRSFFTAQINYLKLGKYERYNHFPNEYLLTFKNYLAISYNKMKKKFGNHFNFLPESYTLLYDREFLKNKFEKYSYKKGDLWLLKPEANGGGEGIKLLKSFKEISSTDVVSKYIENPYLLYGKKFHIRLYIIITGYKPLKIYIYEEGQVIRSALNYSFDYKNFSFKKAMHLTNNHINFNEKGYNYNITFDSEEGNQWSLNTLRKYFNKKGIDFDKIIMNQIYDLSIKSILTTASYEIEALDGLNHLHSNNIYEFYGFDVMIDDKLKVYLLEFNRKASTEFYNIINKVNKKKIFVDIFNLIGIYPFSHDGKEHLLIENENNCQFKNKINEAIDETFEEFNRPQGGLKRIFPDVKNLDYYKQFFLNPGKINLKLWKILKNNYNQKN